MRRVHGPEDTPRLPSMTTKYNERENVQMAIFRGRACVLAGLAALAAGSAHAQVSRVLDIRPGTANSNPTEMTAWNGEVVFAANNGTQGAELWRSDGTPGGTILVRNIRSGSDSSNPAGFHDWDGVVYFAANNGDDGRELWKTEGSNGDTVMVKNIDDAAGSDPGDFVEHRSLLYFAATTTTHGRELWSTNGTGGGTTRRTDLNAATLSTNPELLTVAGTTMYFAGTTVATGRELYAVENDGDVVLLANINSAADSRIANLTALDSVLVFSAEDTSAGNEPWKSGGTSGSTSRLANIDPTSSGSNPQNFARLGSIVLFAADDADRGMELWKTNGTSGGTAFVKNIRPSSDDSNPTGFGASGGVAFFQANDGTNGRELWITDGTGSNTEMVKNINPAGHSDPEHITSIGDGIVAFVADDGTNGRELWISDGTAEGTFRVSDIGAGTADPDIDHLEFSGGILYFAATDTTAGRELWKYEPDTEAPECDSLTPNTIGPTNATSVNFTVQFSEPVLNFNGAEDLIVSHGGTSHTGIAVVPVDADTYTVTVSGLSGAGTFTLKVQTDPDETDVIDLANNPIIDSATSPAVTIDTLPPISACSSPAFVIGGQVFVSVTQIDGTGSSIQSLNLWARKDDGAWFVIGDISGFSLNWSPPSSGRYFFQTVAIDATANAEPIPSGTTGTGDSSTVYNSVENGPVSITPAAGESITIPMSSQARVKLNFAAAVPQGAVVVDRSVPEANVPPALPEADLINESLSITGAFTGTVAMEWTYDPLSDDFLGQIPSRVYRSTGGSVTTFTPSVNGTTLTVNGITGFSDWFAGRQVQTTGGSLWSIH